MQSPDKIVIVGAGPAGCAAAYDLAQAGRRVLLLDRRRFPRHKACACGLTRKTLSALRYSVDPVIERVCREIVLQPPAGEGAGREVRVRTKGAICAMAVRERFDNFCLEKTLAAGRLGGSVDLRKIDSVTGLRAMSGHVELDVVGEGTHYTLRSPVVIGADGSNGQMRRFAELLAGSPEPTSMSAEPLSVHRADREPEWYSRGFALEAAVPYAELPATLPGGDAPHDLVFDFAPLPGGYGWLFPKGDHVNIGVGSFAPADVDTGLAHPSGAKSVGRALLLEYARQKLGITKLDGITGQYLGMGGHAYVPRGRVLLAGDAAGLVDPLTGEGIHSAVVSGQAAAAAVLAWMSGKMNDTLAGAYARELRPLQETLAFSHRAARAFYAEPERGFKAMRTPLLRSLVLKTYADGLPCTGLLTRLAKLAV